MTNEQEKLCEELTNKLYGPYIDPEPSISCFIEGFKAALTAESLKLEPKVKELIRVLGMMEHVGSPYNKIVRKALEPFGESDDYN